MKPLTHVCVSIQNGDGRVGAAFLDRGCVFVSTCSVPVCIATLYYENGSLFLWQLYNFLKGDFYCGPDRTH